MFGGWCKMCEICVCTFLKLLKISKVYKRKKCPRFPVYHLSHRVQFSACFENYKSSQLCYEDRFLRAMKVITLRFQLQLSLVLECRKMILKISKMKKNKT